MVTIIVVIAMVMHLRSSLLVSALLPLAVLISFIAMWLVGVDSNIMSLSGIAIAIGTMVDMGVILTENLLRHLDEADPKERRLEVVFRATSEVGRPVLTAILTTVVSFAPVFALTGPEGKLFRPLAWTKTFALLASVLVALTLIAPMAHALLRVDRARWRRPLGMAAVGLGVLLWGVKLAFGWPLFWLGVVFAIWGAWLAGEERLNDRWRQRVPKYINVVLIAVVLLLLTGHWMPLGVEFGFLRNLFFIALAIAGLLAVFLAFQRAYEPLLRWFLGHKLAFAMMPIASVLLGVVMWRGFDRTFAVVPQTAQAVGINEAWVRGSRPWVWAAHTFPGFGKEFMPPLDEGSFLYMPTTMPHASIGEALDVLKKQDMAISAIPEVESVVGKIGRVDSPLDPAPISMVETIINYKPEYSPPDPQTGERQRQWRPHIRTSKDIWDEIERAAQVPGSTTAPMLQPIAARIVMLQTGVRAPMAVRIRGDRLEDIERVGFQIERLLKQVPGVEPATVFADRIVGKPYLEIDIDREAIGRYGINIRDVQDVIETAVGGQQVTTTVEGRERYPVRVRYQRELRDSIESIGRILVAGRDGSQIPLEQLARIEFVRGPQVIKSENTKHTGYVIFDKQDEFAEVDVVEACQRHLEQRLQATQARQRTEGVAFRPGPDDLVLAAGMAMPEFIGSYENQVRATWRLLWVGLAALLVIFLILYLQFRSVLTTFLVWTGVVVAGSGGMILLYLYSTDWFVDFSLLGVSMRELFQVRTINLSVAVWVGFIALLGIATDDGVIIASYLDQSFRERKTRTPEEIREATLQAGLRRIRPCLMTTATTLLALLPVLTSTGRGSDVMIPMAIPVFGGMLIELMTLFVVPVGYCAIQEWRARWGEEDDD